MKSLRERIADPNIFRIYLTSFALGLAYGIAISLVAIFLDERGFGKQTIGNLAAWFALGIVSFSLPVGGLIRKISAKHTLALSLLGYALSVAAFPFLRAEHEFAIVRFIDGACSVGVWVSCETILLARAPKGQHAFVTSLYAITMAFGYVGGPFVARALSRVAPLSVAFLTAAAVAFSASAYVALRLEKEQRADLGSEGPHAPEAAPSAGPWRVLWKIKTCCVATFVFGYFQASVVLFLPLFLIESKGISREQTIIIPAFFAAGMLLFSNYAGRFGDRVGHLLTMRGLAVVGTTMIAGFVLLDSFPFMCAAVFVAGASLASISPVSLALQGVVTEPVNLSRATAWYNAFYAAGMLLGPPISSHVFVAHGGATMLYQLAALWVGFIAFSLIYSHDDPASLRRERSAAQA